MNRHVKLDCQRWHVNWGSHYRLPRKIGFQLNLPQKDGFRFDSHMTAKRGWHVERHSDWIWHVELDSHWSLHVELGSIGAGTWNRIPTGAGT